MLSCPSCGSPERCAYNQDMFDRIAELVTKLERLEEVESAAVEYVRDSYRPETKYDAVRFDKLAETLPQEALEASSDE